jgi:Na+-translocating ferredoxin:NAD+ oxidoreductase subunit C
LSVFSRRNSGIRPPREYSPLEKGFWNAAVPSLCVVPLQQHVGSRIELLVEKGDLVREGMVIAESDLRLALPLHAPIPGRVSDIGQVRLFDGTLSPALAIELHGEFDRLGKRVEPMTWEDAEREELLERIRTAGVVCGPRSAVPAHRYLGVKWSFRKPVVVLDLAENEPYMTSGLELTVRSPGDVVTGLRIAARAAGTDDIHVVIGARVRRRLKEFRKLAGDLGLVVHTVPDLYPGLTDRKMQSLVGRRRFSDGVGPEFFTLSPNTAYGIHDAVVFGKPQIDQVVAVGGSAVGRPAHVRVRIGTSIADVLSECGGLSDDAARIVVGGPLTGREVTNINAPITKSVSAVVAMKREEVRQERREACIGCGACVRACPVDLDPRLLFRYIEGNQMDQAFSSGLLSCIECGLCSHVCPSRIPLVGEFRTAKDKVTEKSPREGSA